jgi:hypothetical protein
MKTKTTLAALLLAAVMVPASTQAAVRSDLIRALIQGTKNYASFRLLIARIVINAFYPTGIATFNNPIMSQKPSSVKGFPAAATSTIFCTALAAIASGSPIPLLRLSCSVCADTSHAPTR